MGLVLLAAIIWSVYEYNREDGNQDRAMLVGWSAAAIITLATLLAAIGGAI